jgi:hypothetical protein
MHGSSTGAGHAVDVSGGESGAGQPVPVLLVVVAPPPAELPGVELEHAIIPNSGVAMATSNENINLLTVYLLPSSEALLSASLGDVCYPFLLPTFFVLRLAGAGSGGGSSGGSPSSRSIESSPTFTA